MPFFCRLNKQKDLPSPLETFLMYLEECFDFLKKYFTYDSACLVQIITERSKLNFLVRLATISLRSRVWKADPAPNINQVVHNSLATQTANQGLAGSTRDRSFASWSTIIYVRVNGDSLNILNIVPLRNSSTYTDREWGHLPFSLVNVIFYSK